MYRKSETWLGAGVALCAIAMALYVNLPGAKHKVSAAEETSDSEKTTKRSMLENKFSDQLTKAVLTGQFSVDGAPADNVPKPERYEIDSAQKMENGHWVITSRIQYGKHDLKVPIIVDVFWAGDTPVISLTDVTIPGLGTFTSRVMFYGDRYAGTWQHGDVGGHLWGKVGKQDAESKP